MWSFGYVKFLYVFYLSFLLSFLFFCFSFLEWDPLKSCVFMCLGIVFFSGYISLGLHVWYSYFVVLIFLSGIFSLLTYFCSLSFFSDFCNYYYFLYFFFLIFSLFVIFFDYDFFSFYLDLNFLYVYYDFSYIYVLWVILILFLLLSLVSFNFDSGSFMRGLWMLNSFTMSDYGSVSFNIFFFFSWI